MPLYDYRCGHCKREFEALRTIAERKSAKCQCGGDGEIFIKPGRAPSLSLFQPGVWRDIQFEPLQINTPQELRDACDRNNCYSDYLENSIHRTSPGPDPEGRGEVQGGFPDREEAGEGS